MRVKLTSVLPALALWCAVACAAAPSPGSLTPALAERDLGKRSKLALDNAGAVMKEMRGQADAAAVRELVLAKLA